MIYVLLCRDSKQIPKPWVPANFGLTNPGKTGLFEADKSKTSVENTFKIQAKFWQKINGRLSPLKLRKIGLFPTFSKSAMPF